MAFKKPTESMLLRQCLDYLTLRGVLHWRANAGGGIRNGRPVKANPAGTPDILLVLPPEGRLIGVELKSPTGRLRPTQHAWRTNAENVGVRYWVIRDVVELQAKLEEEGVG